MKSSENSGASSEQMRNGYEVSNETEPRIRDNQVPASANLATRKGGFLERMEATDSESAKL